MDVIDRYLTLLAEPVPDLEAIGALIHEDVVFVEHPNLISPHGHTRDRAGMLDGVRRGAELLAAQQFDVLERATLATDRFVVRIAWRGELAIEVGAWRVGTSLEAQLAVFLDLKDHAIWRQESYDCYARPIRTAA